MASEEPNKQPPPAAAGAAEHAPDPDEDDLDDLDEMLDEFSATKIDSTKVPNTQATPSATAAARPSSSSAKEPATTTSQADAPLSEDEFAKQLQAGMEEMLQELEQNPDMAKQLEEMMASFGAPPPLSGLPQTQSETEASSSVKATDGITSPTSPPITAGSTGPQKDWAKAGSSSDETFQDTIRRTMERMRESSSSATAASSSAANPGEDDIMASLLKELQSASGGEGGDDAFSKMLLGMMEQLTNKEILYEPMQELNTKFPAWLEEHKSTISKEDTDRYLVQQSLVKEIVERFEKPGYSDENTADREFIVERMQKMQEAGAPPPDLVGDTNVAQEMLSDLDNGCPQQ